MTNMIIAGFRNGLNFVRKGEFFIRDEAKFASRVGGVLYFGKLFFESHI